MFVTSFAGNKIIFSFKTAVDDIKINVEHYSKFLKKTVSLNGTVHNQESKLKSIFMQDNTPSNSEKLTIAQLAKRFQRYQINGMAPSFNGKLYEEIYVSIENDI